MKYLWYQNPAAAWEETLPLGNGSLGAMVWAAPEKERIGLNHERLWSGFYQDHNPKEAAKWLPKVRELIFKEEYTAAERLMEQHFLGEYTESYMPAGELWLQYPAGTVSDYRRELCLDEAEAVVSYRLDGSLVRRQYFVSYPERALVICCSSEKAVEAIVIGYDSQLRQIGRRQTERGLRYLMQCPEHVDPNYLGERENAVIWGEKGMKFPVDLQVVETDGQWKAQNDRLVVQNAKKLVLKVSILESGDWCRRRVSYEKMRQAHREDYQRLYSRVELEMPGRTDLPTDAWLKEPDGGLYALYFQYGRYLLISSSREGGLPANLQGIWSWQMRAPWSSNWTNNINVEMNYWPALAVNLKECDLPYIEMVKGLCEEGKKTAASFGCQGSCTGHNTDGWGTTQPVGVARGEAAGEPGCLMWAFWLMAQVWMDQEVWRVYWYHPDQAYLENTVYPLLKESVLFCLDWLTEHEGYYVTCPATTPENQFVKDGEKISVSWATTMDMTLIRELFRNFKRASALLGRQELLEQVATVEEKLYPVAQNADGSICEWYEEKEEAEPGHRHLSHLYGLFPSDLWREDDRLREAARKSLDRRMQAGSGHTGWSLAWVINLYVVLQEREKAEQYLRQMMVRSSYPNLWSKHPPFQIDGNFGVTAAIAHMLVEEKDGEIHYLPCLPPSWKQGKVKGLRLPGGREVSFAWENGKIK